MNPIRKISTVLLSASLALSALPAGAVSYDGTWTKSRYNSAGSSSTPLRPHNNHFCYLSMVEVDNTDTENETARCQVVKSGSDWWLHATLGQNDDADVRCSATCYNN